VLYCLNTICAYHFSISSLPVVYVVVTYKVYKGTTTPYVLFYCLFYFIALHFFKTFFGVSRNPQPSQIPLQIAQSTCCWRRIQWSSTQYHATETTFQIVARDTETTSSCSVSTLAPFRYRKSKMRSDGNQIADGSKWLVGSSLHRTRGPHPTRQLHSTLVDGRLDCDRASWQDSWVGGVPKWDRTETKSPIDHGW
jgi:hypothetical protein